VVDIDFGALVIRVALGAMLVAHGGNKVWGPGGLAGTAAWFEALGLRPAAVHARIAACAELAAGCALVAGLLTPLACAVTVGLMVVAALTDHRGKGFFVFKGGWEYVGLVGAVAVALAAFGPGGWSLDRAFALDRWAGAWSAAVVGVAGGVSALGLLVACYRPVGREVRADSVVADR
jgi:putative oxidoreductase